MKRSFDESSNDFASSFVVLVSYFPAVTALMDDDVVEATFVVMFE